MKGAEHNKAVVTGTKSLKPTNLLTVKENP